MEKLFKMFKKNKEKETKTVDKLVIMKEENPDAPANVETAFHYRVSEESGIFIENDGYAKITMYSEKTIVRDSEAYQALHDKLIVSKFVLDMLGYSVYGEEWKEKYKDDVSFKEKVDTYVSYFTPISQEEYELGMSSK